MRAETVRYNPGPMIVAGEPGKSGFHGDWLAVARAIDNGHGDIWAIARELLISPAEVQKVISQMGYLIVHESGGFVLDRRGVHRLRQAEANGR